MVRIWEFGKKKKEEKRNLFMFVDSNYRGVVILYYYVTYVFAEVIYLFYVVLFVKYLLVFLSCIV